MKLRALVKLAVVAFGAWVAFQTACHASSAVVPGIVNFQGQLKMASGPAPDGPHVARFTLYNGDAGNLTVTGETGTFKINSHEQVTLTLAHKNIVPSSVVVKSADGTTTYAEGSAFSVNTSAGVLTSLGAPPVIPSGTAVIVNYQWIASSEWTETDTVTTVAGLFSVQLGLSGPISTAVLTGADWLQVEVQNGANWEALLPRQRLASVPYALGLALPFSAAYTDVSNTPPFMASNSNGNLTAAIEGISTGDTGSGVSGEATGANAAGVAGGATNASSVGVLGSNVEGDGVHGSSGSTGTGVFGQSYQGVGVKGVRNAGTGYSLPAGAAIWGDTNAGEGVVGTSTVSNGVHGRSTTSNASGVYGESSSWYGVAGRNGSGSGIAPSPNYGAGVYGDTDNGYGVIGLSGTGIGLYAQGPTAALFRGNVQVVGNLSKSGGSFKIDDPIDPANKYLSHSFVESPDMMNVYNGNVTLDASGTATVQLPAYFEALNRDFRYQLTAVGAPGPNLYVAREVHGNAFSIAGGAPGGKVSWQVTGVRKDAWAETNRIPVEEDKGADRGRYLYPQGFGQPASRSLGGLPAVEK